MYTFDFTLGDPHKDGHCLQETFTLTSNLSAKELTDLYLETVKRVGRGLDSEHKGPCSDYDDHKISAGDIQSLGLSLDYYNLSLDIEEVWDYVEPDQFVEIFIDYMKTHNPSLEISVVENKRDHFPANSEEYIGLFGYGLFNS